MTLACSQATPVPGRLKAQPELTAAKLLYVAAQRRRIAGVTTAVTTAAGRPLLPRRATRAVMSTCCGVGRGEPVDQPTRVSSAETCSPETPVTMSETPVTRALAHSSTAQGPQVLRSFAVTGPPLPYHGTRLSGTTHAHIRYF
jgi:hypothetical protein